MRTSSCIGEVRINYNGSVREDQMVTSKEAKELNSAQLLHATGFVSGQAPTTAQVRTAVSQCANFATDPGDVEIKEVKLGSLSALRVHPNGGHGEVVLYLHGGGFCAGSPREYTRYMAHHALASGFDFVGLDYALSPESAFPIAMDQAADAFDRLAGPNGRDAGKVFVGGDSAGATLALSVLFDRRNRGVPQAAGVFLNSPWVDLTVKSAASSGKQVLDALVSEEMLHLMAERYLQGHRADDLKASPLFAEFTGLPPMLISTSSDEILFGDADALYNRAKSAGVSAELKTWSSVPHVFQLWAGNLPEADQSIKEIGDWLRHTRGQIAA
jgi:acetyl esterase/lipase